MADQRRRSGIQARVLLALLVCGSIVSGSGCTSLGLNLLDRKKPLLKADDKHPVVDVICLWEAAEGQDLDGLPCRGFAGQVLFFAHGYSEPVLVDGDVTIYVFDDQGDLSAQALPLHEFNFEGPAWNTYGRESSLGAAYQLFVPYTRKGAHHASCAIRVKYKPGEGGRSAYSKMATVVLPGEKSERQQASVTRRRSPPPIIQQAAASDSMEVEPASGLVQAHFESARPLVPERKLQTFSSPMPTGTPRPDVSRLERILRDSANTTETVAADDVPDEEEPVTAPVESRRYRL